LFVCLSVARWSSVIMRVNVFDLLAALGYEILPGRELIKSEALVRGRARDSSGVPANGGLGL
jgi:hypothetical protein